LQNCDVPMNFYQPRPNETGFDKRMGHHLRRGSPND
jgi:hypothetical protein